MSGLPITPPAHVRAYTFGQLVAEVQTLRAQLHEDYATIRAIGSRLDANHLVMVDALGQFARILREELADIRARIAPLEIQNTELLEGIRYLVLKIP